MFRVVCLCLLCCPGAVAIPALAQQELPSSAAPALSVDAAREPDFEPEVTLDELLRRALETSPTLFIAREEQAAAQERVGAATARLNPALQIVPGILGSRGARDEEIILSQPLDLFGQRRANAGLARAELRRFQAQSTLSQRSLVVQVKGAAADLFAAQEAESLGEVQVEVAQLFRDAAARRAELGDVPPVQAQRADLELLRTRNELSAARSERLARRALLNQLIGQAPETPLRVALPLDASAGALLRVVPSFRLPNRNDAGEAGGQRAATSTSPTSPGAGTSGAGTSGGAVGAAGSLGNVPSGGVLGGGVPSGGVPSGGVPSVGLPSTPNVLSPGVGGGNVSSPLLGSSSQLGSDLVAARASLRAGLENRPDIVGAQATLEARRAQVQVLQASRRPQVELQARRNAVFSGGGSLGLRAVVTVPLGSGSSRHEQRALEAEARAQEARIALLQLQARAQLEGALIRLQQQRETVERYRTPVTGIVPQTLDLLRKTQLGFAQGASTYLEVLEAQRTLRQVQTEYLQALVGAQTQQIALESALGTDLPASISGTLINPGPPAAPPGTAAPGTVPPSTIPPNTVSPIDPAGAPPANTVPLATASPAFPVLQQGK